MIVAILLASVLAGAVAAIAGFGIGSLLTPLLALETGTRLAVAAIAVPHFIGTLQRFVKLRRYVDRRVLVGFGLTSAVGGLAGALLHTRLSSGVLAAVFGTLLLLAGISELTGWVQRVRWGRRAAWIAGALSGALGGLVGNQGGIRAAAMLGFEVPRQSFVATATAIGLIVDLARLPVYLAAEWRGIAGLWLPILVATAGVVIGTELGTRALLQIPERIFRRILALLLLLLGVYMLTTAASSSPAKHSRVPAGPASDVRHWPAPRQ
jgi:uncharacterized membrane protein YfcA